MTPRPRVLARPALLLSVALLGLGACTTKSSEASNGPGAAAGPLPTIGIGSDIGQISGGADVRAIDAGAVTSIVMIGDSITVGATSALDDQFARLGFDDVTIVAQQDKRIGQSFGDNSSGADIAAFAAGQYEGRPEERLWIVALGTNDISQYSSESEVETVIESVLASIPDDAPLIWVNTYFADRPDDTDRVNTAIEAVLARRGNATVGRWHDIAPADGVLRRDGVHPNEQGATVFASLVTTTVANFLQTP